MYRFQARLYLVSNLIIAFLWLMLQGISQQARAEDTIKAKVNSYQIVDACGNTKDQVVISIDLGKIVKADSLFGCNFQLSYDSTKLKMHSGLYINTLAEFFEFKQVGFLRSGKIIGVVATNFSSPQVTGSLPLIAFLGDYLTSCKDSVEVRIDYLEFTDEFKKPVVYQSGYVIAEPQKVNDLYIKVYPKVDTNSFAKDSSEIEIILICEHKPDTVVSRLAFTMKVENSKKYMIKNAEVQSTDIIKAESIQILNDSLIVKLLVNGRIDGKPLLKVRVAKNYIDSAKTSYKLDVKEIDECACATRFIPGNGILATEEDNHDTTGVENQNLSQIQGLFYNWITDEFLIRADEIIQRIEIYSILGEKLYDRAGFEEKFLVVPGYGLSNGYYIAILEFLDRRKEKKILIKI